MTGFKEKEKKTKRKAAALSLISNACLMAGMVIVGTVTGSVGVISEGLHTGMDVFSSCIAYFSVRKSSQPPDKSHPFGHGKFEDASGIFEAVLIIVIALFLVWEAVSNMLEGNENLSFELLYVGMIMTGITAVVKLIVSLRLMTVSKRTDSVALESDAWHLRLDCLSSVGVLAGLILIQFTHLAWIDSVIAIIVAICILPEAILIIKKAFTDLMDGSLNKADIALIEEIISRRRDEYMSYESLKTRKAGPDKYAEFTLIVPQEMPLTKARLLADSLEMEIKAEIPRISVTVCIRPCDKICGSSICTFSCKKETQ